MTAVADLQGPWTGAPPPPGWMPPPRRPIDPFGGPPGWSGDPFHPRSQRPRYREPHPISVGPLMSGLASGLLWVVLFGSLGSDLLSYAWWTLWAVVAAWIVAAVLTFVGDRGVAVGVAISAGLGASVAVALVGERWISTNDWPMW